MHFTGRTVTFRCGGQMHKRLVKFFSIPFTKNYEIRFIFDWVIKKQ